MELFLSCPADEVLIGGAAGGGKTEGLLVSGIGDSEVNVFQNPNWKTLYLRRTFPELENSAILRTQHLFSDKGKFDSIKHRWTFPQGGIYQFGHIKNEDELSKHHSAEWTRVIFDELTTFTERMYLYLFSRLRSRDEKIKPRIRSGTNPGNLGHAWVKRRFIENKKPYEIYHSKLQIPNGPMTDWSQCFIPATVFDNKYLMRTDPMYVRRLMELPEVEKQALLYGNWDIFSGQFFPELSEDHIIDDFSIPTSWPIWISMDWGYMTRCAILMWTQDPDTKVYYCFRELYLHKVEAEIVAEMIKSSLGDMFVNVRGRYTDKRIRVKDETSANISTQEKFQFRGVYFQVVDDSREEGWHRCREMLLKDKEGNCRMRIFRGCANFIRTMSEMVFDPNHPEDLDKRSESHCVDSFRYFAITRHALGDDLQSRPVDFSSITGYIGGRGDDRLLRHQIPRLAGYSRSSKYFLDRKDE